MDGIFNHIVYITPKNVLIKSIDTVQIPEFVVNINNQPVKSKIMIEDKYVTCFLFICGNWYAIMRLFGKTLNTGVLARTEKNRAFFKLNNIHIDVDTNNPNNGSGLITIPGNHTTNTNKKQFFATSNTPIIQLTSDSFTNINKQSIVNNHYVFYILQEFRLQKLIGNSGKYGFIGNVAEDMVQ